MTEPLLRYELDSYAPAAAAGPVLSGCIVEVAPGSLTVVHGTSGSGKSLLGSLLAGLLPHGGDALDARVRLAGQRLAFHPGDGALPDRAAWGRHVGLLPQDARTLFSAARATVAEEIAFALEQRGMERATMQRRVGEAAGGLGLDALLAADPFALSGGQQRLAALAALVAVRTPVLVLDEPFAGLDSAARRVLAAALARLRARGTGVVLLGNGLEDDAGAASGADAVLRLGSGTLRREAATAPDAARVEGSPSARADARTHRAPEVPSTAGGADPASDSASGGARSRSAHSLPRLKLIGLAAAPDGGPVAVRGLDLELGPGERLALTGANGAGKTTVLATIAGLLPPAAGTVLVDGAPIRPGRPAETARRLGLALQHPADQLFERTVEREVRFGLRGPRAGAETAEILEQLGLRDDARTHPWELPAAKRRLAALATVLVRKPGVLLLDEPTSDLDADARDRLEDALAAAAGRGAAIVFTTHDAEFAARTADRQEALRAPGPGTAPGDLRDYR
ncbi:ATP-binding cassette domain-containing protein [Zafaria sp. Z1313]|uniref:ATP-binding cassette domain-containing protein n=1 Tax=Zafaria sp. Z1313 TaxID=3423202 RepID=UPI003D301A34